MKTLNYRELELIVTELNQLGGAILQKVNLQGQNLFLSFWRDDLGLIPWGLQMRQNLPLLVELSRPAKKSKEEKPLSLFIKKHFLGAQLVFIRMAEPFERIVFFDFIKEGEEFTLEFRLIPTAVNLIATAKNKNVSFLKIKELPKARGEMAEMSTRPLDELYELIEKLKPGKSQKSPEKLKSDQEKKLRKAIKKLEEEKENKLKKIEDLEALGLFLKTHQNLEAPTELHALLDFKLGVFENMSSVFERLKKKQKKIVGLSQRFESLKEELLELEASEPGQASAVTPKQNLKLNLKKGKKIDYKTVSFEAGERLLMGKSAQGNTDLIRAAKPWYLWFHLRDYPSCHGILTIEKKQKVNHLLLLEVGKNLVSHNFNRKKEKYQGIKFDIVYCEVRHVRTLKSAPGKVTYINDKNLTVQM